MSNIRCANRVICECSDSPIANLSAEAVDRNTFLGVSYDNIVPQDPIGHFGQMDCDFKWVWSDVSQEMADQIAAAVICPPDPTGKWQALDCNGETVYSLVSQADADQKAAAVICPPHPPRVPPDPPKPPVWPPIWPPIQEGSYPSDEQTCTFTCPNGDSISHTVAAGRITSTLNLAHANALAYGICLTEINLLFLCFANDPPSSCLGGGFYSWQATVIGGTAPYLFGSDPSFGPFPPGLTLTDGGLLSGTPTSSGHFYFQIWCVDTNGVGNARGFTMDILDITTPTPMPDGEVGVPYIETLVSNPPYAPGVGFWSVVAGTLPDGLVLDVLTGQIIGTPTTPGINNFTIGLTV